LPEPLLSALSRVRRRWRLRSTLHAAAVAGAVFGAAVVASTLVIAAILAGASLLWLVVRQRALSLTAAARLLEDAHGSLDNLVVSAAELEERPRPVRPEIQEAIVSQANERLSRVNPAVAVRLVQPGIVAAAVMTGCVLLVGGGQQALVSLARWSAPAAARSAGGTSLIVRVTPPAYTKLEAETFENPVRVTVIEGSRIRIESGTQVLEERVANLSASLVLRAGDSAPRFLSLIVVPDGPPAIRVAAPGKDVAFATPAGRLAITVESRDDLGLASMTLRFTKATGGGESMSFTEGEVPLAIERTSDRQWSGRVEWSLDTLGLADGDILVYGAVARDRNPRGRAVQSEQYLIEIGRNSEIASAGFALPAEEKRYGISQQMVIYKTEQLIAKSPPSPLRASGETGFARPDNWLEESRMIALEQRMVRAEVVFLSGGEVEDEVEEAAHSHELAEGRLQNQGRAEMVRALNFMSRAEAQLNDGRAAEALVFERQALASLERALDRRRYFLRTLPDRSRIDLTRRLTGELRDARSWARERADSRAVSSLERVRFVLRDLASAATAATPIDADLAARVAAVDPASPELQNAAVSMATASTDSARRAAAWAAMQAVTARALKTLPPAAFVNLRQDRLAGRLADELESPARPRP